MNTKRRSKSRNDEDVHAETAEKKENAETAKEKIEKEQLNMREFSDEK